MAADRQIKEAGGKVPARPTARTWHGRTSFSCKAGPPLRGRGTSDVAHRLLRLWGDVGNVAAGHVYIRLCLRLVDVDRVGR
jgi:hypothetical protein